LLDFGLARAETFTRLTESGIVLGTIAYLAPEQIRDSRFSPASDVYSLGVTGYEMFTGKRPFNGETSAEIMTRILNESPVEPRQLNKDIPRVLNGLILRMMNKVPDRRPEINEIIRVFSSLEFPAAQQPTTPIHQME
jgi:serine/threonine protein kinase